jgi:hypothetical protein
MAQEKFMVPPTRKLVGILGSSGWFIDTLAFVFDDGSATPRCGRAGGDL